MRAEDGAGLEVAGRVRAAGIEVREYEGEPVGLIGLWSGAGAVVLVDAVSPGAARGSARRFDASPASAAGGLPAAWSRSTSTHGLDVAEAIELGRAVGRPAQGVVAAGIEGRRSSSELGPGRRPGVHPAASRGPARSTHHISVVLICPNQGLTEPPCPRKHVCRAYLPKDAFSAGDLAT